MRFIKKISIIALSCIIFVTFSFVITKANNDVSFDYNRNKKETYLDEIEEKGRYLDTFEIESLREEDVKHFRLSDGTYRAVSFGAPVHQKDSNGEWKDIDNTLELINDYYQTYNGRLLFSKSINSKIPFCIINGDDFSISFNTIVDSKNEVVATVDNKKSPDTNCNDLEKIFDITNKSHINYNNIYDKIDLDFYFEFNRLTSKMTYNNYLNNKVSFILEVENVIPIVENESLIFCDELTGKIKYKLVKPIINDLDDDLNRSFDYKVELLDDNKYELTINYSGEKGKDGLFSEIIINENYEILDRSDGNSNSNISWDTYISSASPSTNYGGSSYMKVSSNNTNIALIRTYLPTIPDSATIDSAYISVPYYFSNPSSSYTKVGAYQVMDSWSEYGTTWNSNISIGSTQLSYAYAVGSLASSQTSISLSVTELAKDWYSDRTENYGIACKYIDGYETTVFFRTWESGLGYPIFTVDYNLSSLIISNGTYYIKNGHLSKYIQIDDGDAGNNYNTEGAILELWTGTGVSFQRWIFEYLHNGYYKIKSYRSNKVISVEFGYENSGNHSIRQETYTGSYRQQWSISLTSHGLYKIKPRSSEGYSTDWVMCCAEGIGGNGRNVQQREYSNNTIYKDEWYIEPLDSLNIILCGVINAGHDHTSSLDTCKQNSFNEGYNNVSLKTGIFNASDCLSFLKTAQIFTSRSHGLNISSTTGVLICTGIMLNDEFAADRKIGLYSHYFSSINSISLYIQASDYFYNCDIALFVGCKTALGGLSGNNLPSIVNSKGAEVSLGFEAGIDCSGANQWTIYVYDRLLLGDTIEEAVEYASSFFNSSTGLLSSVIFGNNDYTLSH